MATQALRPEIELVVDDTTTSNVISHSNHEPTSLMVAKRSLTSLNSILAKFHAGYFRISLSLGGQALWWKTLIESPTHDVTSALRRLLCTLPSSAFLALWSLALFTLVLLSLLYLLRCLIVFFFFLIGQMLFLLGEDIKLATFLMFHFLLTIQLTLSHYISSG